MKTEHKFALALKNMMAEKSLDEISVLSLCKRCKVNRQTFYYYFHDIYDLLSLVFLDEKIVDFKNVKNQKEMLQSIFEYYVSNQKFIDAALQSAGKELFQEFIYNTCYQASLKFINSQNNADLISLSEKKNLAKFDASAFSSLIVHYLSTTKNKSLIGLINCFSFLNFKELDLAIKNIINHKKKEK